MPATATDRIDGLTTSVAVKPPCVVATTGNITLSGEQTVDGVACVTGDRVLVKNQTDAVQNGIWVCDTGAWSRARDFDGARDAVQGSLVIVVSSTGVGTLYRLTTANPVVFETSEIQFDPSAFGDSSTVNFTQSGTGAVTRTVQAKAREWISVTDFGATGDGVTDDGPAFALALTAAAKRKLFIPNPSAGYRIASSAPLNILDGTCLMGESRESTRVFLDTNATLFTFNSGAQMQDLFLDGNSKTGIGINVPTATGQQTLLNVRATNFNAACLNFASTTAGSGFRAVNFLAYQVNGASGTGNYAVVIADAVEALANPRHFANFETGGNCSISFGGANSLYITNAFLDDMLWSANTRAVFIGQSRIAGTTTPLVIRGGFTTIVGCDVYPVIQLVAGTSGNVIGPNGYNNPPVDDNSGSSENLVYNYTSTYTPTLGTTGSAPTLGDGTITGRWSRQGNMVFVNAQIVFGTTTDFGSGILTLTLPADAPTQTALLCTNGQVRGTNGGLIYFGTVVLATGGVQYVELQRDTVNGFTFDTPVTWVTGDVINVSFTYTV